MKMAESKEIATASESAIVFGEESHLVGVCTRHLNVPSRDDVGVVMVSAGVLSSCGPYRLHTKLSKALQRNGITSLRFDLSGIGDSLAAGFDGTSLERAAHEISSAIDFLQEDSGISQVVVFGLCSGADDALYAATKDDRIVGLFSIDGLAYRTRKYTAHRLISNYLPKLTSKRAWSNRIGKLFQGPSPVHESLQMGLDVREFPDRDTAAEQLMQLVDRGVALHFHYTGGFGDFYNYEHQFRDMFKGTVLQDRKSLSKITTSYSPESDHVAFLIEHREQLVAMAADRIAVMCRRLGPGDLHEKE